MNALRASCWVALLLLTACGSAQTDWNQARATHTVAAYEAFIDKHPNTPESVQAHQQIAALNDERAWAQSLQANSAESFESYLQQRPSGLHSEEARDRISAIERTNAWYAASLAGSTEALQDFLERYPQGPLANQARAHLAKLTGYRVELAAVHSEKQAEQTRDRLQDKYGDILGTVVVVPGTDAGQHLVLSADMGPDEARSACAKLKEANLTCEVIRNGKSTA
jgi:SPOR domain